VTLDSLLGNAQVAIEALADSLLLRGTASTAALGALPGASTRYGTRSVPALQAFSEGRKALQAWDLATADSAFSRSLTADGQFSQAALWLALVRSWTGLPAAGWSSAAQQAISGRDRLAPRDQVMAAALVDRAADRMGAACPRWDSLAHASLNDFVSWYGLGDCLASDKTVLRDVASPSGWRFRTSYRAALAAYRQAYLLVPSILMALRDRDLQSVRRLYKTSRQDRRMGRAEDGTRFMAAPSWSHDSLALVPWPVGSDHSAQSGAVAPPQANIAVAVGHQRQVFLQTVQAWVVAYPDNPDALAALAQALEMRLDPTAPDTMERARRFPTDPADRLQIGAAAVALQLKQALTEDMMGLAKAIRLADSLLNSDDPRDAQGHLELATLAALTGRTTDALHHLRNPGVGALLDAPPVLSRLGPALELLAALGGPRDSLVAIEGAVRDRVENELLETERPAARMRWLARPAMLAWPDYISPLIAQLRGQGDYFLDAVAELTSGDTSGALAQLDSVAEWRTASGTASVTVDQLPALASVYALAGRRDDAAAVLDATLLHLFGTGPDALDDPVRAASLGRSIALRAEIAWRDGDTTSARRWAHTLEIIWHDADPALQPVVRRMHQLVGGATNAAEVGGSTRRR
jgi:tetratricopeptide (TPR) repeat protein